MQAILINYNYDPTWLLDYPELEVSIYDRSDDRVNRDLTKYGAVYKTTNMGDVDHDKLSYLIENYDNLPEVFLWGKTNIFKYVDKKEFDEALTKKEFTPLLKLDHKIYSDQFGAVNRYAGTIYEERADSWFFNNPDLATKYFKSWEEWAWALGLPRVGYIPFAPGGNYILTREAVRKHSRDLYEAMRNSLNYAMHPAEAHAAERSYYLLWK